MGSSGRGRGIRAPDGDPPCLRPDPSGCGKNDDLMTQWERVDRANILYYPSTLVLPPLRHQSSLHSNPKQITSFHFSLRHHHCVITPSPHYLSRYARAVQLRRYKTDPGLAESARLSKRSRKEYIARQQFMKVSVAALPKAVVPEVNYHQQLTNNISVSNAVIHTELLNPMIRGIETGDRIG